VKRLRSLLLPSVDVHQRRQGKLKSSIKGYRELSNDEIVLINRLKSLAEVVGETVDEIHNMEDSDKRWAAIARTDLQTGFMALIRAVAKPETF
jgi:hypothetical protein